MATDASGTPTPLGIPKFNPADDAPSGLGTNAMMDAIDTLIAARLISPAGSVSGDFPVWNGSAWVRSSTNAALLAFPTVYDRITGDTDAVNTVASTPLWSKTIRGGDLGTSKRIRVTLEGDYLHNAAAGDTVTLQLFYGATVIWQVATSLGSVIAATRHGWRLNFEMMNKGSTGTQSASGIFSTEIATVASPTTGLGNIVGGSNDARVGTFAAVGAFANSTVDNIVGMNVIWSAASASNSFRVRSGLAELL